MTEPPQMVFAQLGPDVLVFHLALEKLNFENSHQARTGEAELDGEVQNIHLDCLAVGSVMDILVSVPERDGIRRCGEEV